MKRALVLFLLLFLVPATIAKDLPQPAGPVNDFANVIPPEWAQKLTDLIAEIEKNTTVEIAVVTVPSLDGETPEGLALQYLQAWGVGKKAKDNGILILAAMQEHKWRIEVGYGLEGILTDSVTGRLGRHELVPYFKEGKYGEGLYRVVSVIGQLLSGDPEAVAEGQESVSSWRDWIGVVAFFYIWLLLFCVGFIQAINDQKTRRRVMAAAGGIGFVLIALEAFLSSLPFRFTFVWSAVLLVFLVIFVLIEVRRPKKLPAGTRFWWGGSHGFGGIGGGSGGFGGFGGGGGGGGGAGGGW